MSELMKPQDTAGVPSGHERISGPANIRLSAQVVESGRRVHDLLEQLRHGATPARADLRPLAEALARHCKGTEATARRALEDRHAALDAVREDREEGESLQRMLADLMTGEQPEGTYPLMVGSVLAQIDQYVGHERRDLVPAIDRELSPTESARLARAFPR